MMEKHQQPKQGKKEPVVRIHFGTDQQAKINAYKILIEEMYRRRSLN
jgi:hypothetical protein